MRSANDFNRRKIVLKEINVSNHTIHDLNSTNLLAM